MTTQNENKKKKERAIISHFARLYEDFPSGSVVSAESPDFIIKTSRKQQTGIELRGIYEELEHGHVLLSGIQFIDLSKDYLEEIIKEKEEKLKLYYKKKLDHYWLLLHTPGFESNMTAKIEKMLDKWEISTSFHKVFLFDRFNEKVFFVKG